MKTRLLSILLMFSLALSLFPADVLAALVEDGMDVVLASGTAEEDTDFPEQIADAPASAANAEEEEQEEEEEGEEFVLNVVEEPLTIAGAATADDGTQNDGTQNDGTQDDETQDDGVTASGTWGTNLSWALKGSVLTISGS